MAGLFCFGLSCCVKRAPQTPSATSVGRHLLFVRRLCSSRTGLSHGGSYRLFGHSILKYRKHTTSPMISRHDTITHFLLPVVMPTVMDWPIVNNWP